MALPILIALIVASVLLAQQALIGWAWNTPRTRGAAICLILAIGLAFV